MHSGTKRFRKRRELGWGKPETVLVLFYAAVIGLGLIIQALV